MREEPKVWPIVQTPHRVRERGWAEKFYKGYNLLKLGGLDSLGQLIEKNQEKTVLNIIKIKFRSVTL